MKSVSNIANAKMNLRDLRKSKGLMQKTIAMNLGITKVKYCRYETGLTEIPVGMLTPLAREYGISVSRLIEVIAENQNG